MGVEGSVSTLWLVETWEFLFQHGLTIIVRIQVRVLSDRPAQVTENLALFWRETYPKLKQQLQRNYPNHEWR